MGVECTPYKPSLSLWSDNNKDFLFSIRLHFFSSCSVPPLLYIKYYYIIFLDPEAGAALLELSLQTPLLSFIFPAVFLPLSFFPSSPPIFPSLILHLPLLLFSLLLLSRSLLRILICSGLEKRVKKKKSLAFNSSSDRTGYIHRH